MTGVTESFSFASRASARQVTFRRGDPQLTGLIRDLDSSPGIYSIEIGDHVIRVGKSTQLGRRLRHHLEAGYGEAAARRAEFPDHFEFHHELLDRQVTIRWLACPVNELNALERAAIRDAPGGVLWERLRKERTAVKRHAQTGRVSDRVREAFRSWGV